MPNLEKISASMLALQAFQKDAMAGFELLNELRSDPQLTDFLQPHLQLAAEMSVQESPAVDKLQRPASGYAAIVVDRDGIPVAEQAPFELARLNGSRAKIDLLSDPNRTAMLEALAAFCGDRRKSFQLLTLTVSEQPVRALVQRLDGSQRQFSYERRVRYRLWIPGLDAVGSGIAHLRQLGLSKAEAALVTRIAAGQSIPDIAADSSVSVHTLRSQLKSVFRKTGLNSQGELIQSTHLLAQLPTIVARSSNPVLGESLVTQLADGRALEVVRYGAKQGIPLIVFAGSLESGRLVAAQAGQFAAAGLTYWLFQRPGYGCSDPAPTPSVGNVLQDLRLWLKERDVQSCLFYGRANGAKYALAATQLAECKGVLLTNPTLEHSLGADDGLHPVELGINLLRRVPMICRSFARLLAASYSPARASEVLRDIYRDTVDNPVIDSPVLFEQLLASVTTVCNENLRGVVDETLVAHELTEQLICHPDVPIRVLHAAKADFKQTQSVKGLLANHNDVEFRSIDDAGRLIFYTHFVDILEALKLLRPQVSGSRVLGSE